MSQKNMEHKTETIIFDLGGVLIDWNPVYLYKKIFDSTERMTEFLTYICTSEWNEEQDAGRSLEAGTELLVNKYPEWELAIRAFYGRWEEMLGGIIEGTLDILHEIHHQKKYRLLALTNWSNETFPIAVERYEFLHLFEGILVSGKEKIRKPNPKIYQLLIDRYQIDPVKSLFIDDNLRNVEAAIDQGIPSIHFQSPQLLRALLAEKNIL